MTTGPGGQPLDVYLAEVATALTGPPRARRDVLAELRSGLMDAADAHRRAGLPEGVAVTVAIREFGDPRQVAAAFRPELTATHARRTALIVLATAPVVGLLWALAALTSNFGIRLAPPWQWAGLTPGSHVAVHLATGALVIATLTALVTVAATGRLTRWLPAPPRTTAATAAVAGFAAAGADLAIVALLGIQFASASGTLDSVSVTVAAAASLVRFGLARRAAHRCLAARATLTG